MRSSPDDPLVEPSPLPVATDSVLRDLYDAHGPVLLNYLLRLTRGDRHLAEDILQETMLRAWRNLDTLVTEVLAVRAWLYTVARRIAIDHIRAQQSRPIELGDDRLDQRADPDDEVERLLNAESVRQALASLPDRLRIALIESYLRERPVAEIAAALGIPQGTVKSRTFYALQALRRALEGRGFTFPD
ncbi:sigma-70 family RNA polymerase sigma factor [Dactylosporangium sp. AC04546]|uniref:sigma-70 family RNA polymerase sigma factor n=1 Tax=Dactylosporangium sp. AC04546 TaxID=2862460 RepID=UPI001EDD0CE6|nr:sigma-70 family RNA polymerase sigma factor [Dactylosporangium sp. AC04546]WVK89576.1 sigma-70 family RNA polymerase sigma factor [Dactylosporangium sp. AC04546]